MHRFGKESRNQGRTGDLADAHSTGLSLSGLRLRDGHGNGTARRTTPVTISVRTRLIILWAIAFARRPWRTILAVLTADMAATLAQNLIDWLVDEGNKPRPYGATVVPIRRSQKAQ